MRRVLASLSLPLLLGCSCDNVGSADGPPTGYECEVQFRRDVLGGDTGAAPLINVQNGRELSIRGKLLRADAEWVVIEGSERRIWIPRANVLLIDAKK